MKVSVDYADKMGERWLVRPTMYVPRDWQFEMAFMGECHHCLMQLVHKMSLLVTSSTVSTRIHLKYIK